MTQSEVEKTETESSTDGTQSEEPSQENEKDPTSRDNGGKPDEISQLRKKSAAILKYLDKHPHR